MGVPLEGKVALVTGGGSGIGAATARVLSAAGAQVVVADINFKGAEDVAVEINGAALALDVSNLDANIAAVATIVDKHGGLDIAHLNAGVVTGCSVGEDFDLMLYRRAMGANLDGVVFGIHAVLPAMRARGGGAIVATASLAGLTALPLDPIYTANKHAVVGLIRAFAPTVVDEGIRANAICPGFTDSALVGEAMRIWIKETHGVDVMPAETVGQVVLDLVTGDSVGECWCIQPGRIEPFHFHHIPGPR